MNPFSAITRKIIDSLSFGPEIRHLRDILNRRVEQYRDNPPNLLSHPGGISRALHRRRIGIAQAYIHITREVNRKNSEARLCALKTLEQLSFHAKTVKKPINTARVQIEIMKRAVKYAVDPRKQMEQLSDFTLASYGHEAVTRRFLRELGLAEVPEKNMPLKDLDMGWDWHVHDYLTEGRKTPSRVVLDAFIRGISRLTVVYYDIPERHILHEVFTAGEILGIDVRVGIEFSVGKSTNRKHFMFVPPASGLNDYISFFDSRCKDLCRFIDGLEVNRQKREKVIHSLVDQFNHFHLLRINEGYENDPELALSSISLKNLDTIVPYGQYSRNHLGELLYNDFRPVVFNRMQLLRAEKLVLEALHRNERLTDWEASRIRNSYSRIREYYQNLNPFTLEGEFFSGKKIVDYDSAFPDENTIFSDLKNAGGTLVFVRPLERGFAGMVETVFGSARFLDAIEIVNMRDNMERNPAEIIELCAFIDLVNNGDENGVSAFLHDRGIQVETSRSFSDILNTYREKNLVPVCGSASTDRRPNFPGMGFIRASSIPKGSRKDFSRTHNRLPKQAATLILTKGRTRNHEEMQGEDIFSLGVSEDFPVKPGLSPENPERLSLFRIWKYLNPWIKNLLRVAVSAVCAYLWFASYLYMGIWLGITFTRNVVVDLISASGFRVRAFSIKDINFENTAQSLFWTGFSVPVLGLVKIGFDQVWILPHEGLYFEWARFFTICMANGIYISFHNMLRKFDKSVIRANFFRSILAWPFASAFAPVGSLFLIPAIVQAKFWSDVVAAVIEGTGKIRQRIHIRRRDLLEILPLVQSAKKDIRLTAMLDLLYIWAKRQQGRACLKRILKGGSPVSRIFRKSGVPLHADEAFPGEERRRELLVELKKRFEPALSHTELSRFVLEHYNEWEAEVLVDLIGKSLVDFSEWLEGIRIEKSFEIPDKKEDNP